MVGLAVVTGGGRGIGAAISRRLAHEGYRVLLTYHTNSQAAEEVIAELKEKDHDCFAAKVDCGDASEVMVLADHPWVKRGVDVLVLNHGMYERAPASELSPEAMERTMAVNFTGAYLVWEALAAHLLDDARIVVIGSQLGIKGSGHGADYAASKGALHAWARSLALDVARIGQRVNVVAPGAIDTAIVGDDTPEERERRMQGIPMGRLGTPDEVAGAVSFLVGADSSYLTGAVVHVNGGLYHP